MLLSTNPIFSVFSFRFAFFLFFIRGKCRAQFGYLYVWLLTIADETRMLKQSRGCRRNRKFRGELAFNVSARAHLNGTLDKQSITHRNAARRRPLRINWSTRWVGLNNVYQRSKTNSHRRGPISIRDRFSTPLYRSLPALTDKGDRGQGSISHQTGSSRFSPPTQYSLDVSKTASLPPSYLLRISRELFSSSVSLSQSTDYTVTEFVSETVSDLSSESLASISLSTKYCLQWRAPPPVIPPLPFRYTRNVHRFQRIQRKRNRGSDEDILSWPPNIAALV